MCWPIRVQAAFGFWPTILLTGKHAGSVWLLLADRFVTTPHISLRNSTQLRLDGTFHCSICTSALLTGPLNIENFLINKLMSKYWVHFLFFIDIQERICNFTPTHTLMTSFWVRLAASPDSKSKIKPLAIVFAWIINKTSRVTHTWSQYVSLPSTFLQEVAELQGVTAALLEENYAWWNWTLWSSMAVMWHREWWLQGHISLPIMFKTILGASLWSRNTCRHTNIQPHFPSLSV